MNRNHLASKEIAVNRKLLELNNQAFFTVDNRFHNSPSNWCDNPFQNIPNDPYMQKTCDVAEKAILAKKKLRKKCVNRDKM